MIDEATVGVYDAAVEVYAATRPADPVAAAFGALVPDGRLRADLGCGPGMDTALLGRPVLALDASTPMLASVAGRAPDALPGPGRPGRPAGPPGRAGGSLGLQELPARPPTRTCRWPSPTSTTPWSWTLPVRLSLFAGSGTLVSTSSDSLSGRRFSLWAPDHLTDVVAGAGFTVQDVTVAGDEEQITVVATRRRSLPDFVGPGLRLLVCGLNPSLYAADAGVNFARPGNRFWPAARAAGLVTRDRDPWHAVRHDRLGLTDLVKRATTAAVELERSEYAEGTARLERLCALAATGGRLPGRAGRLEGGGGPARRWPGSNPSRWAACRCTSCRAPAASTPMPASTISPRTSRRRSGPRRSGTVTGEHAPRASEPSSTERSPVLPPGTEDMDVTTNGAVDR